jgi:hypothetical protein
MDFELNEDQRAFAQTARDFAVAELAPHAAHGTPRPSSPKTIAKAGELGFCGLYAPESPAAWPAAPRRHAGVRGNGGRRPQHHRLHHHPQHGHLDAGHLGHRSRARPLGPAADQRRKTGLVLPDRARRRVGRRIAQDPRRPVGTNTSSTAPRPSSRARAPPTCWCSWPARATPSRARAASAPLPCPPMPPASATARRKKKWAGTASPRAPSALTTCASRQTTCWAARAKASRSP